MAADIDGRYRVNRCYCHDATWQDALQALVRFSDVVLMDLRGFQTHNAGCRYELRHACAGLAQASCRGTDGRSDRLRRGSRGRCIRPARTLHMDRGLALQGEQAS